MAHHQEADAQWGPKRARHNESRSGYGGGRGGGGGGGYGHSGNRGGGSAYGRGGTGVGAGASRQPRPTRLDVKVNLFQTALNIENLIGLQWTKYQVSIYDAVRTKKLGPGDEPIEPWEFQILPRMKDGSPRIFGLDKGSSPISRRVLLELQNQLSKQKKYFATDGANVAVAPQRLFHENGADDGIVAPPSGGGNDQGGVYGPVSECVDAGGNKPAQAGLRYDFAVCVKKSCDGDHTDADLVRPARYIVRFTELGLVQQDASLAALLNIKTALEIVLKNTMIASSLKAEGKSPRMFQLPYSAASPRKILGEYLFQQYHNYDGSHKRVNSYPYIGMSQMVRICSNGNVLVNIDADVDWFHVESLPPDDCQRGEPILVLDERTKTIAGVKIHTLHEKIQDQLDRESILNALDKISFHMRYTKPNDLERENAFQVKLKEEGKSEEEIQLKIRRWRRRNTKVLLHKTLARGGQDGPPNIIWDADDLSLHSFEYKNEKVTIATYFENRYNVKLKYPHMPAILIKDGKQDAYFPIEFLHQAFSKVKGVDMNKHVLAFNDEFASTRRVEHLMMVKHVSDTVMHNTGKHLSELLQQFNIRPSHEPMQLEATVLEQPTIHFRNIKVTPNDGSWDLRDKIFVSPASMSSFAFLDLHGNRYDGTDGQVESMRKIFEVMNRHGILTPSLSHLNNLRIVETSKDLGKISKAFKQALVKAEDVFLYQRSGHSDQFPFAASNVLNSETGQVVMGLVKPIGDLFEVILPIEECGPTHSVPRDGVKAKARLMAFHGGQLIDMFNLRWCADRRIFECRRSFECQWEPIQFDGKYAFQFVDGYFMPADQVDSIPLVTVQKWQIECPSIIFVRLEDDNTEVYNFVKLLSNVENGIQSQCFVEKKFQSQKTKDQYCSNIAVKVNTKLFELRTGARAWTIQIGRIDAGLPWLSEVSTMVVGFCLTTAGGKESKVIVTGSVNLEPNNKAGSSQIAQGLRIQEERSEIDYDNMYHLTKALGLQYVLHNGKMPKRVLVYRSGSSEGNFDAIIRVELCAMRKAYHDLALDLGVASTCPNSKQCQNQGCTFCTPTITFIVALTQHTIRLVPAVAMEKPGRSRPNGPTPLLNVPSGTCVDHTIMDFLDSKNCATEWPLDGQVAKDQPFPQVFAHRESSGFDFLLTSHGGLKGTSKPVLYRVIANENFVWKPHTDCTQLTKERLQQITYAMSFQYGTATKAVRMVPVLKYSSRLGNLAMSFIPYLEGKRDRFGIDSKLEAYKRNNGTNAFGLKELGNVSNESVKSDILHHFSPFAIMGSGKFRTPFRPHLSA